jgi:hypothetical protein
MPCQNFKIRVFSSPGLNRSGFLVGMLCGRLWRRFPALRRFGAITNPVFFEALLCDRDRITPWPSHWEILAGSVRHFLAGQILLPVALQPCMGTFTSQLQFELGAAIRMCRKKRAAGFDSSVSILWLLAINRTTDQNRDLPFSDVRQYIQQRGWENGGEYVDTGWSGVKAGRPESDRLSA